MREMLHPPPKRHAERLEHRQVRRRVHRPGHAPLASPLPRFDSTKLPQRRLQVHVLAHNQPVGASQKRHGLVVLILGDARPRMLQDLPLGSRLHL